MELTNPANLPDPAEIEYMEEPMVSAEIMVTTEYIGSIMQLCEERRRCLPWHGIYGRDKEHCSNTTFRSMRSSTISLML